MSNRLSKCDQKSPIRGWLGPGIVGLWLVPWSFFSLTFDGMVLFFTARTWMAQSYPMAPGEIIASEMRHNVTDDGNSFQAEIRFRYEVDGRELIGDRLSFMGFNESSVTKSRRLVERYSVGRKVDIFYNPSDPSDAALDRTLNGLPLFMALFLMPFNLIMFGGWAWIARRLSGISSLPLRRDGPRWLLLRTHGQPLMVAIIAAGVMSFLSILAVSLGGWSESVLGMTLTWMFLLGLSGLAFWHTRSLVLRDPPLFVLDNDLQSVTWPKSGDAPEQSVLRSDLLGAEMDLLNSQEVDEPSDSYSVSLKFTGDNGQPAKRVVLKTRSGNEADALTDWLDRWAASRS